MTESDVREAIAKYLARILSVEQLEDALPDGEALDAANDIQLQALVLRTMAHIAETTSGEISEFELRHRLTPEAAWVIDTTYSGYGAKMPTPMAVSVESAGTSLLVGAE